MQQRPRSFTVAADGILRVLSNEVHVTKAFDPSSFAMPPSPEQLNAKKYIAIWDTGATGSGITQKVVDECGLKPISVTQVHTASGMRLSLVYLVGILLPNKVGFPRLRVTELTFNDADVIIGMDIITRGDFAVTNTDGKTVFSYRWPSTERIDFVKRSHQATAPLPPRQSRKVGRNDPCPCGSGKKFKNCHGR